MPNCPPLRLEAVRSDFNALIRRLGGKDVSERDAVDREPYLSGLNKAQKTAYNRAYFLWSEHEADVPKINRYLDAADKIKGTAKPRVKTEAESRQEAPIAAVVTPKGGAPSGGLLDFFRRNRNPVTGQFAGVGDMSGLYDGLTENVKAGWDKFLNLAVRNLSHLRRESPESHTAALRAGGSIGQATILLQLASNKIEQALKGSGITWPMVRAALVESRLRGIRERYLDLAMKALDATDEELSEALAAGMLDVLKNIEGHAGLEDTYAQRAVALADSNRWDELRSFLTGAFETAADRTGRVFMGPDPNAFEKLTAHPAFQEALRLYKDLMEKPIAEGHALNEGIFSTALGPLNTYYPLIAVAQGGGILHKLFGPTRFPFRKPKNIANYFATGLASHGYSLEMEDFADRIKAAIRTNNKANLLSELDKQGLILTLDRYERAPSTNRMPDGTPAQLVDTGIDLLVVRNGKTQHVPGARALVPNWLHKELKPMLDKETGYEPGMGRGLVNAIIMASLIGPLDFSYHATNIVGTLTANTPFLGKDFATATVGNLPMTKWLTGIIKTLRTDPTDEESVKDMTEMAKIGLIPPRFGSVTISKRYAELTGAKRGFIGAAIYGPKGIDIRARLVLWRIAKLDKGMTPQERFDFVSQLGVYNRELESRIERFAKATRLAPFATAGMTMLRNGIFSWVPGGPIPAAGGSGILGGGGGRGLGGVGPGEGGEPFERGGAKGAAKRLGYRLAMALSGGAAGLLAFWALTHKKVRGKWPWQEEGARMLEIEAPEAIRDSKWGRTLWGSDLTKKGYINFAFFSPLVPRGGRALGLSGAFDARSKGQMFEASQRDIYNSLAHPFVSGPLVRAPFVGFTGLEPQLSDLRDMTGRRALQFYPAIIKAPPGGATLWRQMEEAALNVNPFAQAAGAALGVGEKSQRGGRGSPSRWTRMVTDIIAPRLIGSSVDVVAAKQRLQRAEKAAESHPTPYIDVPQDVRLLLHKHEIILSKQPRKPSESDADYVKRAQAATDEVSKRIRVLKGLDEFKQMDGPAQKRALQEIVKDARSDAAKGKAIPDEAETGKVRKRLMEDTVTTKVKQTPEYRGLTPAQQQRLLQSLRERLSHAGQ